MAYSSADIRNVCLVGPSNAGKTQLVEALLHAGGAIAECGSVDKGDTVSDFTKRERELGHSQFSSVCHFDHKGIHVNLIDTPGYRDFYGRALSVIPAAETAAVVINAQEGIEMVARRMMDAAQKQRLCRMIIVNKIDAEDVDLRSLLNEIRSTFGQECLPMNLPSADGEGVVDCFFQPDGAETAFSSADTAHVEIVDQVVEVDEELMEVYLEQGQELEPEQLHDPFEQSLREGHLVPICFVSARTGAGIPELLEVFERLMPNPMEGNPPLFLKGEGEDAEEVVINPDPDAHAIAHVFMVNIDPFKGRLGVFRIHQGTIRPGNQLFVGDARKPIKVNQLLKLNGAEHHKVQVGVPGDICAIPRVDEVHYDAVLHDSHDEDHFHLKSIQLPRPMYGLAIKPAKDSDAQRTSDALHAVEAEDPSLTLEHIASLNEIVLRGHGELHLRTVLEQIADRYNLEVLTSLPSIAYRETITAPAEGHHRHKKQTGGAGQFGEVYLRVEPLPSGQGFEFASAVVGGSIPSQYIPAVETGVRQVMGSGAIHGYPMQDIKVTVYDGKHHAVDSKEIAFVQAGKKAFLDAIAKASPIVLEPIVDVTITVPSRCAGGVTGDLSSMRGMVTGTEARPDDRIVVTGQAPLKELQHYHSRLKSLTGGDGSFSMDFSHYAEVSPNELETDADKSTMSG
ncbi:MAG: elongation factor G [Gammaproteobacteria bacterium]|nr:elongation factor G [Gammaproteobacteria bacterium]MDH3410265.1 elongation factor G [Gammaproteobacteria bacterium]